MIPLIQAGIFGFIGGLTRGLVGIFKLTKRKKKFKLDYFASTLFLSAVIGIFAGLLFAQDYRLSLLAGYAGTDLIEGLYKIFISKFKKK